jgi:rhamnopyranosyl-N-acetylglucosaminyl-diphospho-decaprenol beta-1,3/1,4-galactofuranosyltransferase
MTLAAPPGAGTVAAVSVAVALVTFNRKALLVESIEALLAQTSPVERILVVDNASTDGTPELLRERGLLDEPRVVHHRLAENSGGAGGFAEGVRLGLQTGSDWVWLLDDDAAPEPDALERLLAAPAAADPGTVALCPKVVLADGRLDHIMRGDFHRRLRYLPEAGYAAGRALGFTSFVGPLVRAEAARAAGLPKAEFFVWGDDVEYSLRLRRYGELRLVPNSVIVHKATSHGSYQTPRSRALNRISPVKFDPTPLERFWQNLCGLRNYLWIKREYEGQGPLSAAGTTLQFVVKHGLWDDRPLTRIRWVVRFARDGRRGRFENIPPPRWAEMVRSGQV